MPERSADQHRNAAKDRSAAARDEWTKGNDTQLVGHQVITNVSGMIDLSSETARRRSAAVA